VTRKLDNALVGAAGVHFVASELSLRGLIALPTIRNAPGIDLLVTSASGDWHANLQVKASQYRVNFWPISARYNQFSGPGNFYVFVRYLKAEARFEAFLETADRVIADSRAAADEARRRGNKEWAPWWPLPKDEDAIQRVRRQWHEFGPDHC